MKRLTLLAILVAMLVALTAGVAWAALGRASGACDPTKTTVEVHAGEDLDAAMQRTKTCATFRVHNDSSSRQTVYKVSEPAKLQAYDRVVGVSNLLGLKPAVAPQGQVGILLLIPSAASSAEVRNLHIRNAWGDSCTDSRSGIGLNVHGSDAAVEDSRFSGNPRAGIAGPGVRMRVSGNIFVDNGSMDFAPTGAGGGCTSGTAAQIKVAGPDPLIEHNTYRGGEWNGIWCDVNCDGAIVRDNLIKSAGKSGIFIEISDGPSSVYSNEVHKAGSNPLLKDGARAPGLFVVNSASVDAHHNTFGDNPRGAFDAYNDLSREGRVSNVFFHENTLNGDSTPGCSYPGVTCTNNR